MRPNYFLKVVIVFVMVIGVGYFLLKDLFSGKILISPLSSLSSMPKTPDFQQTSTPAPELSPTPTPSPTPIPTPNPAIYGPCKNIPVVFYHHVQPKEEAGEKHQKSLTVDNKIFESQMNYLVAKGYHTLTPDDFLASLSGTSILRSILLTFDDGYEDFYKYAYQILVKDNLKATLFLPTGLVGNPDYLSWPEILEMKGSGLITFANHTWSHKNLGKASDEMIKNEIETAQNQLLDHGLGPVTAFAYPYGLENIKADKIFTSLGIKSAFTTFPGSYQCTKLPYDFRRIRIGNSNLSSYGF